MAFLDLHEGILEEFAELAFAARHTPREERFAARQWSRRRAWVEAQNERYKKERAKMRASKRAARPPCPRCGGPVTRDGVRGKVPEFCSRKCTRAAIFARWYAKHGAERNERRRAA